MQHRPTSADQMRAAARRLRQLSPESVGPLGRALGPLAEWLDATANRISTSVHPDWQDVAAPRALAIARAINQEKP